MKKELVEILVNELTSGPKMYQIRLDGKLIVFHGKGVRVFMKKGDAKNRFIGEIASKLWQAQNYNRFPDSYFYDSQRETWKSIYSHITDVDMENYENLAKEITENLINSGRLTIE